MLLTMRLAVGVGAGLAAALASASLTFAHGGEAPPPTLSTILSTWSSDLLPWVGIVAATSGYLGAVWFVDRAHPATRVPRWRIAAWLAGVATIAVALISSVDVYAGSLFSVHMLQHLLLAMVAPPLLALGAPITLALR